MFTKCIGDRNSLSFILPVVIAGKTGSSTPLPRPCIIYSEEFSEGRNRCPFGRLYPFGFGQLLGRRTLEVDKYLRK